MTKAKNLIMILITVAIIFLIPSVSNATNEITVSRNVYSNDGSMEFIFTGLTIDTTHEYEYGITKTSATAVEEWYLVTKSTATSVTADIKSRTKKMREVIDAVDTGYITIKDKTTDTVVVQPYAVDLKLPFLKVTNFEVLSNGKDLKGSEIEVPLRNADNSTAHYKYEKITDQNLINKYKEIKANSGDYSVLETLLKTSAPTNGYSQWEYWNGYQTNENGHGYPTRKVNAPDEGLYYLWVHFRGENLKDLYGCILVDNLQPDIAVDGISLPETATVELGETITLHPIFNPSTATNKIVTWTSSDEEVATVDNAGKITPKKVGSTIITVTTQDGNKKATCTVTVTEVSNNNPGTGNENTDNGNTGNGTTDKTDDKTTATGKLPQTGLTIGMTLAVIAVLAGGAIAYFKYNKLRDI